MPQPLQPLQTLSGLDFIAEPLSSFITLHTRNTAEGSTRIFALDVSVIAEVTPNTDESGEYTYIRIKGSTTLSYNVSDTFAEVMELIAHAQAFARS